LTRWACWRAVSLGCLPLSFPFALATAHALAGAHPQRVDLLIGIDENKDLPETSPDKWALDPQPLAGVAERIDQVARSIPDPPLPVTVQQIPATADSHTGYLLVHVPPSPHAPHMVDGKYPARGDTTRHYLNDAEVRRLHDRGRVDEAALLDRLRADITRDPIPADLRKQAHLFLLAQPLGGVNHLFTDQLGRQELQKVIDAGLQSPEVLRVLGPTGSRFSPDLSSVAQYTTRTEGAAFTSHHLQQGRTYRDEENEDAVDVVVNDDGAIHVFMGRLSDSISLHGSEPRQWLFDYGAVIWVRRLVAMVTQISQQAGYLGSWGLAAGATGVRGLASYGVARNFHHGGGAFDTDDWVTATQVSYADLVDQPGTTSKTLLRGLLRTLGTAQMHNNELSDPATPPRTADDATD
jgi:hypothetical protein